MMAQWSPHEDEQLRKLVKEYGPKRWSIIASKLKTKGSKQCRRRWKNHLNADLKSGGWTVEEDRILMEGHRLYGNRWTEIAKMVGGRTDNAVKNRYAALCKRDSRGAPRGGAARGGRGSRKARVSDSDGGASDVDVDVDDDSDDAEEAKRTSSSSISREASPPPRPSRGSGRGDSVGGAATHSTPAKRGTPASGSPLVGSAPPPPAAASGAETAGGSTGGNSLILGRRRQPPAGGTSSPPLQPEVDAAALPAPAKRRMLLSAGGGLLSGGSSSSSASGGPGALGRQPMASPLQPRMPEAGALQDDSPGGLPSERLYHHQPQLHPHRPLNQAQQLPHQQQQPWQAQGLPAGGMRGAAGGAGWQHPAEDEQEEEMAVLPAQQAQTPPGTQRAGSQDGAVCAAGSGGSGAIAVQPKKLPLTINIPNAASAEPSAQPSTASGMYGIEIRVLRDLLTPCEIQYVRELNDMQLPLHINVDDEPSSLLIHRPTAAAAAAGSGASLLVSEGTAGPAAAGGGSASLAHAGCLAASDAPLTTSRQGAHNALAALFSPGCATAGAMSDFNDVLKWFQTGLTPRSSFGGGCGMGGDDGTPRLLGRGGLGMGGTGITPCGLRSGGGGGIRGGGAGRGGCDEDDGSLLGTGLTPKFLHGGSGGAAGGGSGNGGGGLGDSLPDPMASSPSKRARRQVAVAAAVAAASAEPAQEAAQESGPGQPGARDGADGSSAMAVGAAMGGLFSPAAGMELHAGHRQLLTKLIQTAAETSAGSKPAGGAGGAGAAAAGGSAAGVGGPVDNVFQCEAGRPRLTPASPSDRLPVNHDPYAFHRGGGIDSMAGPSGLDNPPSGAAACPGPSGCADGADAGEPGGPGCGGVVVMPYFTQQELLLLLEVLHSEDLQGLPPPPAQPQMQQQQ